MGIEKGFDVSFVAKLTAEEKQIQQNYRPIIGVHKWFARRPGALFRSLLVSEFAQGALRDAYFGANEFNGITVGDPFMGGGTTLFEANRVGCNVVGFDINPMAYWIVRQELASVDRASFRRESERIIGLIEHQVGELYQTTCVLCKKQGTVKYFLWVKQTNCGSCGEPVELFPGYLVAEDERHPKPVLYCPHCKDLVEVESLDKSDVKCPSCRKVFDWKAGPAKRQKYSCACGHEGKYPEEMRKEGAPTHRLFGIEYYCSHCRGEHYGRFFKSPDAADLKRFVTAVRQLPTVERLLPDEEIPDGDETKRLHRWGYRTYRQMFNERQLLTLGLLVREISKVKDDEVRHGLATVFSDFLRYQNMLCRYDTYALKCQDVFAVHGFPVGLVQCENNVIGIPRIGSGGFRHFIEKYDRAKAYGEEPFETVKVRNKRRIVRVQGEHISGQFVDGPRMPKGGRGVWIVSGTICEAKLKPESLDAVFTDPPYFDNVQYAELMDFCYVWLRRLLPDVPQFQSGSTRSAKELTGNETTGKGLEHFTEGLSNAFVAAANALKPHGPFAFTYHHNRPEAYAPVIVAILNAGLVCTAAIPCPAEMSASLHINGTTSSVIDSVFVCRKDGQQIKEKVSRQHLSNWLTDQAAALSAGTVHCTQGDLRCIGLGFLAKSVTNRLVPRWNRSASISEQLALVRDEIDALVKATDYGGVIAEVLEKGKKSRAKLPQPCLFD